MDKKTHDESSLSSLIDYILVQFHEPLKTELPPMMEMSEKLTRVHGANHPELREIEETLRSFSVQMMEHLRKEENILFPMMRAVEKAFKEKQPLGAFHCGSIGNPIRQMEVEHGDFENNLKKLRSLTNEFVLPNDACRTYTSFYERLRWLESDTLEHATLENTQLHTLAKRMELGCHAT